MYKSPIEKIYGELQTQMVQEDEKLVMKAIREVGVDVDKDELIKALQYDRNQYTKGYEDGKNEILDKIRAEIEKYRDSMRWNSESLVKWEAINYVLEHIIDKYKTGSEPQGSEKE